MSNDKRYTNKELLEAIKYFLSMVYKDENGELRWKERSEITRGGKTFNTRQANELACNTTSGRISYNGKLICFGLNTIYHVMKHGKLPLGNGNNKMSVYPDTKEGLEIYQEFLSLVEYHEVDRCFYWKRRKECDRHDKRFNTLHAGKKIKYDSKKVSCNMVVSDGFYTINLLHALWLLKKGVPSELRLYMLDKDRGLSIDNISDE